jgi:hypothetical protein
MGSSDSVGWRYNLDETQGVSVGIEDDGLAARISNNPDRSTADASPIDLGESPIQVGDTKCYKRTSRALPVLDDVKPGCVCESPYDLVARHDYVRRASE